MVHSAEQLSRTVEKIYAAAADPALWSEALSSIEHLTGSVGAVLDFIPKTGDPPFTLAGGFTLEQCAEYARSYQSICPRIGFAVAHPEVPIHYDALVLSEAEMDRDPVYNWFAKHDLRYYVGARLCETTRYSVVHSLQRSPKQGHVQAADLDLFSLLKPHLEQALSLADRLGSFTAQQRIEMRALETLPQSAFGLDSDGLVLFANSRAEQLLRHSDGLAVVDGTLRAARQVEQAHLDTLLRRAASPVGEGAAGWMRLERPSGKPPYAIFVSHFPLGAVTLTKSPASVLVMVIDPSRPIEPDLAALRHVFDLTDTEAKAAIALASGHDLASGAASLGIGLETMRSHAKAVFRKLGVHRQQDVVRVLSWLQVCA